ncbi:hypothetical protein BH23ACT6_BH23ACT6_06770 [soil metagenome]
MGNMHWYPETPRHRRRRIVADLLVLGWVAGWWVVGAFVHAAVSALSAPAGPMRAAGTTLQARMTDIAERVTGVPLVGDELQAPFVGTAAVGTDLSDAATRLESSVADLAWSLSLLIAGTPVVLVLAAYGLWCVRAARRRRLLAGYRNDPQGQSLLALRALSSQSLAALGSVGPDPVGAWRRDDPDVVASLAGLELAGAGLHRGAAQSAGH